MVNVFNAGWVLRHQNLTGHWEKKLWFVKCQQSSKNGNRNIPFETNKKVLNVI